MNLTDEELAEVNKYKLSTSEIENNQFLPEYKSLNTVGKGQRKEFWACCYLLSKGFEVFKNISYNGPIDVVAWKDGKFYGIDVKTVKENATKQRKRYKIDLTPKFNKEVKLAKPILSDYQIDNNILLFGVGDMGSFYPPEEIVMAESNNIKHSWIMKHLLKINKYPGIIPTFGKEK